MGTFRGTGDDEGIVLAAALPYEETRRVWVTDTDDTVVLDALVEPTD
ncbi:MAG: hypothetical protein U5R31_06105 [Acidimicrobiia bacterium]|nr:hypothetical protein [Acidimicrobiia bacterium]